MLSLMIPITVKKKDGTTLRYSVPRYNRSLKVLSKVVRNKEAHDLHHPQRVGT